MITFIFAPLRGCWRTLLNGDLYSESKMRTKKNVMTTSEVPNCCLLTRKGNAQMSSRLTTKSSSNKHLCDGSDLRSSAGEIPFTNRYSPYCER